jgi:outer membrane protein OmpA-like peptidoglycan-associated protein
VKNSAVLLAALAILGVSTLAQAQTTASDEHNQMATYSVNVASRTTRAVKYAHRSGSTKIDFQGTDLMPGASGDAKVESKRGTMQIEVEFQGLDKPTSFGTEYLTYVMWAISPEGRSANLGEVLVGDNRRSKLDITTDLQTFALIVTAEPYYAVRRPSNVVVVENVIRPDTVGTSEAVDAKYELIDRGGYIPTGYHFDPVVLNSKLPLEFFEARNAVRIAKSAGAENYAAPSYEKAVSQMNRADEMGTMKHVDRKALISASREVVQTADDSREIAVKRIDADRVNADRDREAEKLANARAKSRDDMQSRMNAEAATADANRRSADAERATAEAQRQQQNAQAESDRNRAAAAGANQAAADAQQGQRNAEAESGRNRAAAAGANQATADAQQGQRDAEAESGRNRAAAAGANQATADAQQGQRNAEAESGRNRAAAAGANQATADAQQGQRNAEAESDRNRRAATTSDQQLKQALLDREELRAKLLQQFNVIFATRDTARGLIVSLSDVLFDTGKSTLRPVAREKLAKISGIVLAYPDLRLAIEGNTDSVGTDAMNQQLSEQRASSVREYLAKENIPAASMTSRGFGKTQPVASNDSAEGRQQNRRVELVVSGEVIGTTIGVVSQNLLVTPRP